MLGLDVGITIKYDAYQQSEEDVLRVLVRCLRPRRNKSLPSLLVIKHRTKRTVNEVFAIR